MYLSRLDTLQFRNLEATRLELGPGVVLVTGPNGSGKTSLLEAVAMLGSGRSFRSSRMSAVIRYGAASLTVFGELRTSTLTNVTIGITRERSGVSRIKVAGEAVRTASELASILPVQVIDPGSVELVTEGPSVRRRFLDWGTFHVEPSFFRVWREYRRCLEQRNALLRSNASAEQFDLWEQHLSVAADKIDEMRKRYVDALTPRVLTALEELGGGERVSVHYVRGWEDGRQLDAVLAGTRDSDREAGYTRAGPHRADLKLVSAGRKAADVLSRGQQKILACSLLLAQARQLESATEKTGIYLVDDPAAELDEVRRVRLGKALTAMKGQVWVTSVQEDLMLDGLGDASRLARFHVEQGRVGSV